MREQILIAACLAVGGCQHRVSSGSAAGQGPPAASGADLALVGARIHRGPGEETIASGAVLIDDGKIAAVGRKETIEIPPGTRVLDCTGLTLTAGLWNSHVHFIELKWEGASTMPAHQLSGQLREMLVRYGFTTVFDTGSSWANTAAIRRRIESGEVVGPRVFSVGEVIGPAGLVVPPEVLKKLGFMPGLFLAVDGAQDASEKAARLLGSGADAVKIYAATTIGSLVEMPADVVAAIASQAHRVGKLALAHPYNAHGLQAAVDGGADVLVHSIPNAGELSPALIATMRRRGISLIPTLKLWRAEAKREGMDRERADRFVSAGVEQLRAYSRAGGDILFGTDVGYVPDYDPTEEYELMERAGMSFQQILASLTTAPARRFGLSERTGRIAPGMDADIVALERDPADDVRAFSRVRHVVRAGNIIYRSE